MSARRPMRWNSLLLSFVIGTGAPVLLAQSETPAVQPYASMEPGKVAYRGPGREKSDDLQNGAVHIGLLLPMQGKRAPEGKLLLQAAQIAIDEENKSQPLPNGQRFMLAVEDESGPWGQASSAMVRLILVDESVALITSTDGNIAHQAEQIANKVGIPVFTLSSDPTTTRINIPWIFRMGPSDVKQARVMATEIYRARGFHKVLLITESGHDGRIGGEEFMKEVASLHENNPERLEISAENFSPVAIQQKIRTAQADAFVLWTGSILANQLLPSVRQISPSAPIYLCQKAAGFRSTAGGETAKQQNIKVFAVGTGIEALDFSRRYQALTGEYPGMAAQQMNDAVGAIAEAVRQAGNNRARVRDGLTKSRVSRASGEVVSFDAAGNEREQLRLVSIEAGVVAAAAP